MEYFSVRQAQDLNGLRLVLTVGFPGPWSESAKQILEYKKIPYAPVAQYLNQDNAELVSWVGVRNAPVAVYAGETPMILWSDILQLAERLSPSPSLLPEANEDRDLVLSLSNDICGEWGFGWCRRLILIELARQLAPIDEVTARVQQGYGFESEAASRAPVRAAEILRMLAQRLHSQRARGRSCFVGCEMSACDLYWACFSLMVRPLAHELAPMPDVVRQFYGTPHPSIEEALDNILIEHRDYVFERHLKLPLDF